MSKKNIIIIAGAVLIVIIIGLMILFFGLRRPNPIYSVDLVFWGVFDDNGVHEKLIKDFNILFPKTTIQYEKKTFEEFEDELINAMAAGQGPDILMIHNTWLPKFKDKIVSMPNQLSKDSLIPPELITLRNYQESYVDVVLSDFIDEGKIWAMPLYVDTLGLYYNKDMFHTAGIAEPPATWEEFMKDVEILTEKDVKNNDIIKAGVTIGTAKNVNRSTDILALMMMQSGAKMVNDSKNRATFNRNIRVEGKSSNPGQDALDFYTGFADPSKLNYTWNRGMDYSIDMFYEENAAMMLNYAYHVQTIRDKASYLNFAVARMPQIKDAEFNVDYANYMGLAVSKHCKNPGRAWEYLLWLSQTENTKKYLELAKRPTPRKDLIDWQKTDVDLGIFAEQSLSARSWYQVDSASIESIFIDMIESIVSGQNLIEEAINRAAAQITVLMQ